MNKKKGFSKWLLILDYIIATILLVVFFICHTTNGVYIMNTMNELIESGVDISMLNITAPFNLDIFGVLLGAWISQLGISSTAYYVLVKSERKVQLPMILINDLPQDIKDDVDMTQLITTVLNNTNN
ncbi:MAG: hypothetical protein IJA10_10290 [Lachnospiraceae bacterium]|nr:hypothetical protein [Lachnospiraceae bacterium]